MDLGDLGRRERSLVGAPARTGGLPGQERAPGLPGQ